MPNIQQLAQQAQVLNSLSGYQNVLNNGQNSNNQGFLNQKFNPFLNGGFQDKQNEIFKQQQQQQIQQQNCYTASLAKFMSFCQDNYMQRLISEKYR